MRSFLITLLALTGAPALAASTFDSVIIEDSCTLQSETANTVPYLDGSKNLISSSVTADELEFLSGVTDSIQDQLDAKVGTVTASAPLASSGGASPNLSIPQATGSQAGYLSAADWTIFNAKLDASRFNYVTNPDGEVNTAGWNLYSDIGRTVPAYVVKQDITFTSALSGGLGNGASIQYALGTSPYAEPPVITCPTGTSVLVRWYNGPTISQNPTATVLKAAWDATPCAVAIATAAITGTAGNRQYITVAPSILGNGGDTAPVDGSGGTPSDMTFTRTTTPPIIGGTSDLLLSKGASDQMGNGVATDFTVDAADQGNALQISFYYSASANLALGTASDVRVFLYDITNGVMLPITARSTLAGPTADTIYRFAGQFTAAVDSVSYRLILHSATGNLMAWGLRLHEVSVSSILDAATATQVPQLRALAQPITGAVTDHMAVMWQDGDQAWKPATMAAGNDRTTTFGFAVNLVGLTADIVLRGYLDGFSVGPFLGYNQYVGNTAGSISPLPSPFTDTGIAMGKGVAEDAIVVNPEPFTRLVTSKGGLLTNAGANNGTGDQVLAGGTTGQFLRANTALSLGIGWFTPVATAPIVYTASTSTWSCTNATASVAGCLSAANFTIFNNKAPTASPTFTGDVNSSTGSVLISTAGQGVRVKTGTNAKIGTATLVAGTATVANTSVTANSRIFLTSNTDGGTPGWLRVSAKTNGTSFVITSSSGTDTSTVAWYIVESIP